MSTVYSCGNSDGQRRCDAKCHNATHPECDCVCGGYLHGAVTNGTMEEKMSDLADRIADRIKSGDTPEQIAEFLHRQGIQKDAVLHPQQLSLL